MNENVSHEPPDDEVVFAASYPLAMYARGILNDRTFAEALGYGWLRDEDTAFVRTFREQVNRQAEIYDERLRGSRI